VLSHDYICKLAPARVLGLLNPTCEEFREAFADARRRCRKHDFLVVYLCTHIGTAYKGDKTNKKETGYILLHDSEWTQPPAVAKTSISLTEFASLLRAVLAVEKTVIVNCAHADKPPYRYFATKELYPPPDTFSRIADEGHCVVMGNVAINELVTDTILHTPLPRVVEKEAPAPSFSELLLAGGALAQAAAEAAAATAAAEAAAAEAALAAAAEEVKDGGGEGGGGDALTLPPIPGALPADAAAAAAAAAAAPEKSHHGHKGGKDKKDHRRNKRGKGAATPPVAVPPLSLPPVAGAEAPAPAPGGAEASPLDEFNNSMLNSSIATGDVLLIGNPPAAANAAATAAAGAAGTTDPATAAPPAPDGANGAIATVPDAPAPGAIVGVPPENEPPPKKKKPRKVPKIEAQSVHLDDRFVAEITPDITADVFARLLKEWKTVVKPPLRPTDHPVIPTVAWKKDATTNYEFEFKMPTETEVHVSRALLP